MGDLQTYRQQRDDALEVFRKMSGIQQLRLLIASWILGKRLFQAQRDFWLNVGRIQGGTIPLQRVRQKGRG